MNKPTKEEIKVWLREIKGYPKHLLDDQAQWLYDSYNAELPQLKNIIFGDLVKSLSTYYHEMES